MFIRRGAVTVILSIFLYPRRCRVPKKKGNDAKKKQPDLPLMKIRLFLLVPGAGIEKSNAGKWKRLVSKACFYHIFLIYKLL